MPFSLPPRIFFTGFMATGKSRLGELTAASLGWQHLDTDTLIEQKTGRSIPQIFEEDGETYFRRLEVQVIKEISKRENVVISLGGGALKTPEALNIIKQSGIVVGLWARPEVILERVNRKDNRPLLANMTNEEKLQKIRTMLEERQSFYNKADFQVESREEIPHHTIIRRIIARLQVEYLKPLNVDLGERSYPIYLHKDLSGHAGNVAEKAGCADEFLIVTDSNLKIHQKDFLRRLSLSLGKARSFYFKPGEKEKNLTSINRLMTYMLKHRYSRKTTLVAFGGGVVGDMTGFAAAIYLRGVRFLQIPTTLLAMVDSSVGGKTGVNHRLGKNLIGAFHQPRAVVVSTDVIATLPGREYLAGMAEVIKHAVIWDETFFEFLEAHCGAILKKDPVLLEKIVRRCCEIKAEVVHRDEKENGLRAILNYGHTFAHAIESMGGYHAITHGLAVSLGMKTAARLAVLLGLASPEMEARQNALLDRYGFPKTLQLDRDQAWEAMGRDKKTEAGIRHYILPSRIGEVKKVANPNKSLVYKAWDALNGPGTALPQIAVGETIRL